MKIAWSFKGKLQINKIRDQIMAITYDLEITTSLNEDNIVI